jgi:RNA-directed DNA polymerase
MNAIRAKIRAIVGARNRLNRSLEEVIGELTPVLRGWGNYFVMGNWTRQLQAIDSYVPERLSLFLSKKHGKSGRRWGLRWREVDFRGKGLYQLRGTVRRHVYTAKANR